ncbi:aminotransferase class V-fold PLP-dependent enzyme [Actinomyces viscosus]|uniref:cysteine desulfurase n=1 Tax=Actinomyces viscosus TaxID=1656 RepID=A0A3S4V281_ACTVI|nr:aminotransferase class V-fold PLP-dependent enzyme [Actinomyces viscosus]TFH51601.1 aminotransferase class V-fold PLP-dependent enzyme [Actinomyces viscosus]VEI15730.1 Cysteine desulfurase [Actinomyces viscosus]
MRTYLDHAATSPVRPEVAQQIAEDLAGGLGGWANPSAQHTAGRRVGALLAEARARLAGALGVDAHEVLLTSGGTEADALVVSGRARAVPGGRLVVSPIEHPAVLDSARTAVAELGAGLNLLGVDDAGRVALDSVTREVAPPTGSGRSPASLVSVMAANNETGIVQDMASLVARVREASGAERPDEPGYVPVHSDAVAALGKVAVDFHGWGLDAMSVSGHKLGAPVGVGALVVRRDLALTPVTGGGRQERGIRSGTQDVVAARALALAVELAVAEREKQETRLAPLRRRLLEGAGTLPGAHATLPDDADHVASTAHLWFEEADSEALLMALDLVGIDASAGSACHAGVARPSHVLLAMGFDEGPARSTLRCSLGQESSIDDVERLLAALPAALDGARRAWKVTHAGRVGDA